MHIRTYSTYPYIIHTHLQSINSELFKTAQNLRGIEVVMAFPSPHLPFVSEAGVPVVSFALAPPVLVLEAPVLVISQDTAKEIAQHGGCFDMGFP